MRGRLDTGFAALLLWLSLAAHSATAGMSPVGLWQATDPETKKPSGWFAITEHNGVYNGTLVKMFLKPGQNLNAVCHVCRGDRHNQPWLGLQIIRGMKPDGDNQFDNGTILDPRSGNVYDAMMTLSPDGQTLIVRGYLGIPFLGRNEYWKRLQDSAYSMLDPKIRSSLNSSAK